MNPNQIGSSLILVHIQNRHPKYIRRESRQFGERVKNINVKCRIKRKLPNSLCKVNIQISLKAPNACLPGFQNGRQSVLRSSVLTQPCKQSLYLIKTPLGGQE